MVACSFILNIRSMAGCVFGYFADCTVVMPLLLLIAILRNVGVGMRRTHRQPRLGLRSPHFIMFSGYQLTKVCQKIRSHFINPFYTSHMASKYTHVTRTFWEKSMLQKINPPTVFQILFPRVLHCLHAIVIHQMKDKECSISNI